MKKLLKNAAYLLILLGVAASCDNSDDNNEIRGVYADGIFVTGEGSGSISGSLTYISNDLETVEQQVFAGVNNEELGTYLQSAYINGENAYIVVDNSSTITVADRYTMEKIGAITTGLYTPRYMVVANGKGYVTNWGDPFDNTDDFIAVVNLSSLVVENTIPVDLGPEQIIAVNNKLYVTHLGGYSYNNVVSVINTDTNAVSTIEVEDNPDEIAVNSAGNVVVLSQGRTIYNDDWSAVIGNTPGAITTIDASGDTIIQSLTFAEGDHPDLLYASNGSLYYVLNNEVYSIADTATALASASDFSLGAIYAYGMSVSNDRLFVANASFSGLSELIVYNLNNNTITNTIPVGVGASNIYFN